MVYLSCMEVTKLKKRSGRRDAFKKSGMTPEKVRSLYESGKTDREIGDLIQVSDVAVSYFRRVHGITTKSQGDRAFERSGKSLDNLTALELSALYLEMSDEAIGKIYGVSKTTVRAKRNELGIASVTKSDRSTNMVELTDDQKETIVGTLLGDAHLLERGELRLSHYYGQLEYLRSIQRLLSPIAHSIGYSEKLMDNGTLTFAFHFHTDPHIWLKSLRRLFYPSGCRVFPSSVLTSLTPRALAHWYFDDGHYDPTDGTTSIALGDITDGACTKVVEQVSGRFSLDFYVATPTGPRCKRMGLRARSRDTFFFLIREFATNDLLYKLPSEHRPKGVSLRTPVRKTDTFILSATLVKRCKEWSSYDTSNKDQLLDDMLLFWKSSGFPYPLPNPEELHILLDLSETQVIRDKSIRPLQVGQSLCQSFSKHIWAARSYGSGKSPLALFEDPDSLRKVLSLILDSNDIPNASKLRSGLRFWKRSGVYNFRPSAAKALVDKYCPQGGTVMDPCAGYGGRLLGTILSGAKYIGCDPNVPTVVALRELHTWVASYIPTVSDKVEIYQEQAEDLEFPIGVDVILTSPPYWKREVYSEDGPQSATRYPVYEDWLHHFWRVVLTKAVASLRTGGWVLLNVDDFTLGGVQYNLIADTKLIMQGFGFGNPDVLRYELPGGGTIEDNHEVVLTWCKGFSTQINQIRPTQEVTKLEVSVCRTCGKVVPVEHLRGGVCTICLAPPVGFPVICKGCGATFTAMRKDQYFHSEACYAKYRRSLDRVANPPSGIRVFTCEQCGKQWETTELGRFKFCNLCKDSAEKMKRTKQCSYRHCSKEFFDSSTKNSMSFCCVEHRRREKAFRSGKVLDVGHFRKPDPVIQPTEPTEPTEPTLLDFVMSLE